MTTDDEHKGPFGAARALLGKVVDRVVGAVAGRSEPPPHAPAPVREPVPTRTMAGLLVQQGHYARALSIYEHLMAEHPSDGALREEVEALRRRLAGPEVDRGEPVTARVLEGGRLRLKWTLTEGAVKRAKRVLGEDGALFLRVVIVGPDAREVVATHVEERAADALSGEWVVSGVSRGSLCTASVGVRSAERFVSAGHARVVEA